MCAEDPSYFAPHKSSQNIRLESSATGYSFPADYSYACPHICGLAAYQMWTEVISVIHS